MTMEWRCRWSAGGVWLVDRDGSVAKTIVFPADQSEDAHLIAAAKNLYSALDKMLELPPEHDLDSASDHRERKAVRQAAIAALDRATYKGG